MREKQTKFETWSEFKEWIDKQAELENHLAGNVQIVKGNGNVQAGGDVWKDKQRTSNARTAGRCIAWTV